MFTFIKVFFWMFFQYGLSMDGGVVYDNASEERMEAVTMYHIIAFTLKGDGNLVETVCMEEESYEGMINQLDQSDGVLKVQVQFRALPAARLTEIITKISKSSELIYVETN